MSSSISPKVTVLMPVYNSAQYLVEAINSILNQTWSDFEFLIIDDASEDDSLKIINSFNDKRIRIIHNEVNLKLVGALNKGVDLARGDYIVRMDSDDISLPFRLWEQVKFMDKNPDIGISGGWLQNFGANDIVTHYPVSDEEIRATMPFRNPFAHPSMIMRRNFLNHYNLRYNMDYAYVEDYELWIRCSKLTKMANIEKVLVLYRFGHSSISSTHGEKQKQLKRKIYRDNLRGIGIEDSRILDVLVHEKPVDPDFLDEIYRVLENVCIRQETGNTLIFKSYIQDIWNKTCYKSTSKGYTSFLEYYKFKLGRDRRFSYGKEIKFFFKAIFKLM